MIQGNVDALAETGNASRAAVQGVDAKAIPGIDDKERQELDCRDAGAGRSEKPGRILLNHSRVDQGRGQATVDDTKRMAQLTTAVFTAAFEPVMKRIQTVQNAHP